MVPFIQCVQDGSTTPCRSLQSVSWYRIHLFVSVIRGTFQVPFLGMLAKYADVAQLVEQLIRNQQVIGSSPIVGSKMSSERRVDST